MIRRRFLAVAAVAALVPTLAGLLQLAPASAVEPPLLHAETPAGSGTRQLLDPVAPTPKTIDGNIDDWTGTATGFGGAAVYSHGEYVYTDHLFDAYGADDGKDAQRLGVLDPLNAAVPESYRLDPIFQADIPGEFGVPTPDALTADEQYGDLPHQDEADLSEVRVAADATNVYILARTTTLRDPSSTALLLLADTKAGPATPQTIPFNSGLSTARADVSMLLAPGLPGATVVVNPDGYTNAIEAAIPRSRFGKSKSLKLAIAAGAYDPATQQLKNVANVAFRDREPVRTWFDKAQALALYAGTIDPFFATIDTTKLVGGATQSYQPTDGYHDRVFTSSLGISSESGQDGILQHYGVYVPLAYQQGHRTPATFWMHWRGGKAHSAATVSPGIMRQLGEERGDLIFAPRGRGSSSWYLGEGMVDFNEVWADAMSRFTVDANRVYVTGHSMGGWASYLLSTLYPDRFAGAFPVEGPVTQGAFTGLDFPGCDQYHYDDYSFCYVQTNNGDARTEHTYKLLDNLRNVPIAIYQGVIDELVPVSGTTAQVEKLRDMGYRYRYYLFPNYEHYSHPVVDEWAEGGRYLDQFTRNANPERVTYVRDMPFERAVETGPDQTHPVAGLNFDFDHAYWMSGLTPVDPDKGQAKFDGQTTARPAAPSVIAPEAGGPSSLGQVGPYVMTGQQWLTLPDPIGTPAPAKGNGFNITLTGASSVQLDLVRMAISTKRTVSGTVDTEAPLSLRLAGPWTTVPNVKVDGAVVAAALDAGVLTIPVPAGVHQLSVG